MTFERRLSRTVASLMGLALAGCGDRPGEATTPTAETGSDPTDLEAMCDGGPPPADGYHLREGFVEVPLGADCPDETQALPSYYGCSHTTWQGIVCAPPRKEQDMVFVNDGYGGYHVPADEVPPYYLEVSDPLDLCWYEGVFFTDPNPSYTCGRPLLRGGEAVVAPVVPRRSGWSAAPAPLVADLSLPERERLAAYWLDAAAMEHASVASFARVSLELMRFGAPPELLTASHRAAIDEVAHARLCFALASAYRGEAVAPGPLAVPEPAATSLAAFAEALLREGCIGETLAAVDAAARLAEARDPAVRAALEVVLRDESEHAALAWRTLRWVLASDDGELRARLDAVVAEERERWCRDTPPAHVSVAERAHGLLTPARRAAALARAWRQVVEPSWAAMASRSP